MAAWRTCSNAALFGSFPLLAASLVGLCHVTPASAGSLASSTMNILARDTGWYTDDEDFPHDPDITDYMAGYIDLQGPGGQEVDVIFRDFFVFDLPSAPAGQVLTSATLRTRNWVVNPGDPISYVQTMGIYGVIGSVDSLVNGTSSFNNLGQGDVFAQARFYGSENPAASTSYLLNAAGLQLLKDSLGGPVALSGRNNREVGGGVAGVYVYGDSQNNANYPSVYLDLTFNPDTPPVPAPLPLIGAGAAWSWSRRLRSQNRMRGSSSATSRSTTTVTSTTSAATTTTIP
jgi:MYXO-CTERM domain-containing protein